MDELKTTLRQEFESFGPVLDVVAHKNLRMRGQAFVVFESIEDAKKAQQEMRNREVFGKPMVSILVTFSSKDIVFRCSLLCLPTGTS